MVLYMCGQCDKRQYNLIICVLTPVQGSTHSTFSAQHWHPLESAPQLLSITGNVGPKTVFLQRPSKSFVTVAALPTRHCPADLNPVVQTHRKPMLTMNVLQPDVLKGHEASLDGSRTGGGADRVTQPTLLLWHVQQIVGGSAPKAAD